ncbi:MFS transporter [Nocardia callitridis]|uniref:CynX/NimT family MFS transporter n=1 Tax=Nocardia callitridis TaxID=648753 RepID=A0ABP9JSH9_9NOCA
MTDTPLRQSEPTSAAKVDTNADLRALRAVGTGLAVVAVVLLGLNMRLVFGSASAVLAEIRRAYGLGSGSAALLTTGPVVCLGLFGPLAVRAITRWTVPVVLTGCLILVTAGTALRSAPLWPLLLLGTLLAGIGIAVANVLGPVLVRLLFPHRVGIMTGLLTALVSASAGIASGATVPLDTGVIHSWRLTLLAWAAPAVLAGIAIGIVAARHHRFHRSVGAASHAAPQWRPIVLRSSITWAITGFMGLQSLLAYAMIAWLPTVYRDRGLSAEQAGLVLTALSISSIITALTVPIIASRMHRQSVLAVTVVSLSVVGLLGVITVGTSGAVVFAVLLGLGQGGQLSLALTLVNLRAASASITTSLSTVAQSIGYLIAAIGPIATGILHSVSRSWTTPLLVLLVLMFPLAICGWIAGRPTSKV